MGYNKRRAFLFANKGLASQLTDLADQETMAQIRCRDPEEAGKTQFHLNNVLHSLAIWAPTKAYVRERVRTKVSVDPNTGDYIVLVGVFREGDKLRGAPPKVMILEELTTAGRFVIPDIIHQDNWPSIWLKVVAASNDPDVTRIIFKHPPEASGIKWITEQLATSHFDLLTTKPDLVFERTSANVARVIDSL